MLDLDEEWLTIVQGALTRHLPGRRVIAFGSRTNGKARKYSDLDLCIMGEEKFELGFLQPLRDELEWSRLPMRVDLVEWASTSPEFRKIIENQQQVVIQE